MSEDSQPEAGSAEEGEILDAVPVLAAQPRIVPARETDGAGALERSTAHVMPAVQAAAVAAGGFVAGAAVVGLVHRRQRRSLLLAKSRRGSKLGRGSRAGELVQIVGSRSLLLDVHLLGGTGPDR